jgi:hypothetical protein
MKKFSLIQVSTFAFAVLATVLMAGFSIADAATAQSYDITLSTQLVTGLEVDLTGLAVAVKHEGNANQYVPKINWGDGNTDTLAFANVVETGGPSKGFTATWAGSHEYDAEGPYTITVSFFRTTNSTTVDSFQIGVETDDGIEDPETGTITVIKEVVGSDALPSSFPLFLNGEAVTSGVPVEVEVGTYTVTETSSDDFEATFSESCPEGVIELEEGVSVECTITNTFVEPPAEFVTVTIVKYVGDAHATSENANGASFQMSATWDAENIGSGTGEYALDATGFEANTPPVPYEAVTSEMTSGADYSTYEIINETVGASCEAETPFALVGYSIGNTLEEAASADVSIEVPAIENITEDQVIIVWNEDCSVPPPTSARVQINKFVDGFLATGASADNTQFSMNAVWNSISHSFGAGLYSLGPNGFGGDTTPYQATTVDFNIGADYSTSEVIDGTIVGEACDGDEGPLFALVGYTIGDSYAEAAGAEPSSEAPSFNNLVSNKYAIVWNETCEPEVPVTGDITVIKNVVGEDGETDVSDDTSFTVQLNEGETDTVAEGANATFTDLEPGQYTISELETEGYELVGMSPSATVEVVAGETATITITNKQLPEPSTGPGAIVIQKNVVDEDGHEIADGTFFSVNLSEINSSTFSEVFDATFSNLEPGVYAPYEDPMPYYEFVSMEPEIVTVTAGATTTVVITNRYVPDSEEEAEPAGTGRLTVTKLVTNEADEELDDNTRFRVILNGDDAEVFSMEDPANYDLAPGYYTLIEDIYPGYTFSSMSTSTFQITAGETTRIEVVNVKDGSGSKGGESSRRGSRHRNTGNSGAVLGASTDDICVAGIGSYLRRGAQGDDVMKLQSFLNEHLGLSLPVDGNFDAATEAAVHQLQKLHGDEILKPWVEIGLLANEQESTGFVYKMTLWWINQSLCASETLPEPQLP